MSVALENQKTKSIQKRGQIVVEYVLLLLVSVALAAVLIKIIVSRDPNNPGFLIQKWRDIIEFIGADHPDGPQ